MASNCVVGFEETLTPNEYSHPLHAKCMLTQLNESRNNPRLCDGFVIVEGLEIPVQRNVLAAASPFFRALYSYGSDAGKDKDERTVHVDHISSDTFMQIIDYIYTSVIALSEDNIQDVLQAADVLLISHLKDLCCDFLEQCVSATNCLGICEFTERFSCPHVHAVVTQFMDENFREVSFTEEYLQLPHDRLQAILQRDSLNVRNEDVVLEAILHWIEHDEETRQPQLEPLLINCVRMRFLVQPSVDHKLIRSCHLADAVPKWKVADTVSHERGFMTMLVVCGGERSPDTSVGDGQGPVIENCVRAAMFHHNSHSLACRWIDLAPMLQHRANHAVVIACGFLFAVGGRDETNTILKTGEKYDPRSNSWSSIAPMSQSRMSFGLLVVDDKLYALGGCQLTTSVEEYDIHLNKWRPLPSMNLQRRWCAYAVCEKKIYVLGGSVADQSYEVVECFDPRTESWSSVAPMRERRHSACAVGFSDLVYVFGGYRRYMCPSAMHQGEPPRKFCDTEVYSSEQECWKPVENTGMCCMTPDCYVAAAVCIDDEVVVIGQLKLNRGYHQFVRAYRPATDSWRSVLVNRPAHGQQQHYQCTALKMPVYLMKQLLYEQGLLSDMEKDYYSGLTKIPDAIFFYQHH